MTNTVTMQKRLVTPALAKQLLTTNEQNRNVSENRVEFYAKQMRMGEWKLTHQGVAISESGRLIDGQHRLLAVIKSGASVPMFVTENVSEDAAFAIDQSRPRSKADAIQIGGLSPSLSTKSISAINTTLNIFYGINQPSPHDIVSFYEQHKSSVDFMASAFSVNRRGISANGVKAAVLIAFGSVPSSSLGLFISALYSGVVSDARHHHVIRLRDTLMNNSKGGRQEQKRAAMLTMRSILAFCRYENLKLLREPSDIPFELPYFDKGDY